MQLMPYLGLDKCSNNDGEHWFQHEQAVVPVTIAVSLVCPTNLQHRAVKYLACYITAAVSTPATLHLQLHQHAVGVVLVGDQCASRSLSARMYCM
ncbi:hypothetical protein BDN70DRAFT_583573 [Pholiota conissans]|uniref:Uncharacterized protein n=1 Tax=Pholiota conissans TaxID=109636 RepID=A0A9P5YLF3_9AGAR|nr:hypothetical protein BDN70DRAFT_583573 [Pholiota conissans]